MTRIESLRISVAPAAVSAVRPTAVAPSAPFAAVLVVAQRQAVPAAQAPPQEAAARIGRYLAAQAMTDPGAALPLMLAGMDRTAPSVGAAAAFIGGAAPAVPEAVDGAANPSFLQLKPLFQQAEGATGVPWQIQAAQWALETGWGSATPKDLATGQESHNLFGVKGTGSAGSVQAATTEVEQGRTVQTVAAFRAYGSLAESVQDHARLLASPHYAPANAAGKELKAWTEQLGPERLGYATDPEYGRKLWQIITQNGWDR